MIVCDFLGNSLRSPLLVGAVAEGWTKISTSLLNFVVVLHGDRALYRR